MNWIETTVGEYCPFIYGKSLPKTKRQAGDIPVYGSNGCVDYHSESYVKRPGLIIGRKGSVGAVHLSQVPFWPIDTSFYVEKETIEELKFTFYLLKSLGLEDMNTDSAVPGLNRENAHSLPIRIPELKTDREQLGQWISVYDEKIELNHQTNQTLEKIAQAIFKSWFVDFDPVKAKIEAVQNGRDPELAAMYAISGKTEEQLKGLDGTILQQLKTTVALFPAALVESELGEIPEEWKALPLYDTAEYINGISFKNEDFSGDGSGLPILKIAELKQGVGPGTKYTNIEVKQKYFITNDDILYSWSGSPKTSLEVFKWFGGDGWLNQHIFKLNFQSLEQKYFTYYLLQHMKPVLIATAQQKQTTGLGHVTVADMKRIKVPFPSNEMLREFMSYVSPMYEKGSNTEKESSALIEIRDSLLPKLLSGDIEVVVEEIA